MAVGKSLSLVATSIVGSPFVFTEFVKQCKNGSVLLSFCAHKSLIDQPRVERQEVQAVAVRPGVVPAHQSHRAV
jgi:hypothetical protein